MMSNGAESIHFFVKKQLPTDQATPEMKEMLDEVVRREGNFLLKLVNEMHEFCKLNGATTG